jgi:hypothetical protein
LRQRIILLLAPAHHFVEGVFLGGDNVRLAVGHAPAVAGHPAIGLPVRHFAGAARCRSLQDQLALELRDRCEDREQQAAGRVGRVGVQTLARGDEAHARFLERGE